LAACVVAVGIIAAWRRPQHFHLGLNLSDLGLGAGQIVILGLSVVVAVSAIMIVRASAAQSTASFTELWMLPARVPAQNAFEVGIRNSESKKVVYRLEVTVEPWPLLGFASELGMSIASAKAARWRRVSALETSVSIVVKDCLKTCDPIRPKPLWLEIHPTCANIPRLPGRCTSSDTEALDTREHSRTTAPARATIR
jgi:hypothetical protein